ncbi:Tic20 family protein [Synechococcus sp. F70.1]|uniref:Tic20 family protein n=1 Tax=Synechococcus sp. F70.1 TaxID=2964532 RepID=UPI0039C69F99
MTWRSNITPSERPPAPWRERLWGSLPYLLPLVSALPLGFVPSGLFQSLPGLIPIFLPLLHLLPLVTGWLGMGLFFALLFFVIRNGRIAHFVRFNTMQALLLNIALFLVQVLLQVLGRLLGSLALGAVGSILANTALLGVMAVTLYAWSQNLRGRYAEVPVLSEAAYAWIRY